MTIKQFVAGDRGMTLVEVLVALVILSVGILTAMDLFTNSIKINSDNRDRLVAQNLAQDIIEKYKAQNSLISDQTHQPVEASTKLNNKEFTPDVDITYETVNTSVFAKVQVKVSWQSYGVTRSVERNARLVLKQ